jgi:hypothetical protein
MGRYRRNASPVANAVAGEGSPARASTITSELGVAGAEGVGSETVRLPAIDERMDPLRVSADLSWRCVDGRSHLSAASERSDAKR